MFAKGLVDSSWLLVSMMSILVVTASPARAQDGSPNPPPYAAWTATLPAVLHLTDVQKPAFDHWRVGLERWLATSPIPTTDGDLSMQDKAITSPQRFDNIVHYLENYVTAARAQTKAMTDFYALLSPEQRKLFDDATSASTAEHSAPSSDAAADGPPPPPNYQLPSHSNPDWMARPTPTDVSRVFPLAARTAKISGKVMLTCVADEAGYLTECVVRDEAPIGYGFGNAALEITAYMRMKPATNFGVPARSKVNVPVDFTIPE